MMTASVALPSSYIQQLGEVVEDLGASFDTCMAEARFHGAALAGPMFRGTWPQFEALVHAATTATAKPELGLLLGERLLVHTHGVLGYAAMNAETLSEALQTLEQFIRVRVAF